MDHREIMERVFARLGSEKQLLEYSDCVYKMLGIVIDFISAEGGALKLSKGKNFNPLCECLRQSPVGCRLCKAQDDEAAEIARSSGNVKVYTCYAGFAEIVVPLFDKNNVYLGSLTSGQFYISGTPRPDEKHFQELAEKTGLDGNVLQEYSKSAVELTPGQIEGVIGYLRQMGALLVSSHHNLMYMESVNAPDRIGMIRSFIHENYSKPLSVETVAKKFFFTPNYFTRIFHKTLGIGFNAYLNCYRVDRAKEMLVETDLSIGEIAFMCGFGSLSQFNRVFRCVCRRTPREFRKEAKPNSSAGDAQQR